MKLTCHFLVAWLMKHHQYLDLGLDDLSWDGMKRVSFWFVVCKLAKNIPLIGIDWGFLTPTVVAGIDVPPT